MRLGAGAEAGPGRGPGATSGPGARAEAGPGPDPESFLDAGAVLGLAAGGVVVVTGTGTGVGKTVTASALAALYRGRGLSVHVHKPLQTGLVDPQDPGRAALEAQWSDVVVRGDAQIAGEAAGCSWSTGFALRLPLSPGAAARAAGIRPPGAADHAARIRDLAAAHDVVLVEGAGGLLVDLGGFDLTELAVAIGKALGGQAPPFVVVADPELGTLNHTALTVEALVTRGLVPGGVVLGRWEADPRPVEVSNRADLVARHRLLGAVPRGWPGRGSAAL